MRTKNGGGRHGSAVGRLVVAALLAIAFPALFSSTASAQLAGKPIIAGDPFVGETLTSSSAGVVGVYKWQRCLTTAMTSCDDTDPANSTDWTDIPGATEQTYTIPAADLGYHLRVNTATAAPFYTPSDAVGPVTHPPPPPPPQAITGGAHSVTHELATVTGVVDPNGVATSYRFEYGTTTAYGSQAPVPAGSAGDGFNDVDVSASLTGLAPSTVYHYRLVATSAGGTSTGANATFTTAVPPPPVAQHGISVFADPEGPVTAKFPGSREFVPIEDRLQVIPVNTVIDTRFGGGTIEITAATGPYRNTTVDESIEFYKGVFKLTQKAKADARAIAELTGPRICGPFIHRQARGASGSEPQAVASRRRGRRLWGRGSGRYATRGRGGTGSVVGTTFLTEEKCKGTYFRVSDEPGAHGISINAKDRKKPVFLGPGEDFLAPRRGLRR